MRIARLVIGVKKMNKSFILLALILILFGMSGVASAAVDISNVNVSAIKTDSVVIGWDSTVAGTSQIEYGTTIAYGNATAEESLSYFHTTELSGLAAGTLYHFRITSRDYNGAETISPDYTFTTRMQTQLEAIIKAARADGQLPKTYYVSPTGLDTNDGLGLATPWKTLTISSRKLDVGDTLYVMDGTWYDNQIAFNHSGIDVAPISIKAYPGAKPVMAGNTAKKSGTAYTGIAIYESIPEITHDYISVDGLEVKDYYIAADMAGNHNTLSNCTIYNTYSNGIMLAARTYVGNTLENCVIHDTGSYPYGQDNAIQLAENSKYTTIRNNTIYRILWHNNIDLFGQMQYVTIDGNNFYNSNDNLIANPHTPTIDDYRYITIKNNYFHDQAGNAAISFYITSYSLIYNNTFTNVKPAVTQAVTFEAGSSNIIMMENKFYNSSAIQPIGGLGYYFVRNFINNDSDSFILSWGASGTFINNTGEKIIGLSNTGNAATIQYDDNTVFKTSITGTYSVPTPITYTPTRSYSVITGGYATITYATYLMTARPASGSATVTVNKFDTTLAKGNILVDFTADTANGNNVDFVIGDLKADTNYQVTRGGVNYHVVKSNANKCIKFSNSEWSAKTFTIEETDSPADIITPPEINISNPAPDTTAPSAITDLTASNPSSTSVDLNWTAPGDDGTTGTATIYDIRYATSNITSANWASATQVIGEPAPLIAGTSQAMTVSGLTSSTTYYFAIKTSDEVSNTSELSKVVEVKALFEEEVSPETVGSGGGGGGGGCFIATAVYGTAMAEEVKSLSNLRDKYLLTNEFGKGLVSFYYRFSPSIGKFIKDKEILKSIIRYALRPVIWFSKSLIR